MSPGERLLKDFCSHCHGPPLATSHPAKEWRNVVLRMQKHRIMTGLNPIPAEQLELIVAYLAEQAADVKE